MIRYAHQYLRSATAVISRYDGAIPLAAFLKQYFREHSQSGSKDRKYIAHLCYVYFRTGHALGDASLEEKIRAALFLCNSDAEAWSELLTDDWRERWHDPLPAKWKWLAEKIPGTDPSTLFPCADVLSGGMDRASFTDSHLLQPDLFLRIRPGKKKTVLEKLDAAQLPYTLVSDQCLALANASKVEDILETDREVVIQDLSSQRVGDIMQLALKDQHALTTVWDCCAASGGKSLLAFDLIPNLQLTVSDLRSSILHNLEQRFQRAGIRNYHSFVADLTEPVSLPRTPFQLILCDAPCSGSGTWGRTPEQLYFFKREKIESYAGMQQKISSNVIACLAKNGYLLYITCSVYQQENEGVVAHILQTPGMELVRAELLKGYDRRADTMFAALFRRIS